jgi:hypothetical protein
MTQSLSLSEAVYPDLITLWHARGKYFNTLYYFMKPSYYQIVALSKVLRFIWSVGLPEG